MIELDYDQALTFLERAIEEKGADFTYKTPQDMVEETDQWGSCLYFHRSGEPLCVVGHVMHYMGINSAHEGVIADQALEDAHVKADPAASALLNQVQSHQDCGYSWGEALRMALQELADA